MSKIKKIFPTLCVLLAGVSCHATEFPFGTPGDNARMNYGRGRPMDIQHLKIEVRVDIEAARVEGVTTITLAPVGAALEEIVLDSVGLAIASVEDGDGAALEFEVTEDQLKIYPESPLPPDESVSVRVAHSVTDPEKGMHFRNPEKGFSAAETQAWTQGEAEDHRYWFPCFDFPNERTTTEVIATVDGDHVALSNGSMVEEQSNDDGTRTYHWRQDQPHVVYLVSLVVGPFEEIKDESGPVPLHYYYLPGQEEMARLTYAKTNDMMVFYEDRIGVAYPWDRYGQVAVVDFIAGGMENTTLSTLTDRSLHTAGSLLSRNSNSLIAHELVHQWFGDLLTCRDWSQLWLNEGFASYYDALFTEHDLGRDAFHHEMIGNGEGAMRFDTGNRRKPVVLRSYDSPDDVFTPLIYEKGSWVLHMLRHKLGDALFFEGVTKYVEDNYNEVVETNDLLRAFEAVSGVGLERFFDQWVFHTGYPELTVTYSWDQPKKRAKVVVKQTQDTEDGTPVFHLDTALRFAFAEGEQVEEIHITKAEETFEFNLEARPVYVRFDPEMALLKELTFKKPKAMLLAQLREDPDLSGRYQAIAQLGTLKGKDIIEALDETLREGAFWGERVRAARMLGGMDAPAALDALLAARNEEDARVRGEVLGAIGKYDSAEATAALADAAASDPSPYIVSRAISDLSTLRDGRVFGLAAAALGRDSHNETIRNAALRALGHLEDASQLSAVIELAKDGPRFSRTAAVTAIGNIGKAMEDKRRAREALVALLESKSERVRGAALRALGTLGDEEAIPAVEVFVATVKDEDEAKAGRDSIEKIRSAKEQSAEVRALRERVVTLEQERKELEERIEKIEKALEAEEEEEDAEEEVEDEVVEEEEVEDDAA